MPLVTVEVRRNFESFEREWPSKVNEVRAQLGESLEFFELSFGRLTTLNAWRENVIERVESSESAAFFNESQNDALLSHIQARQGGWRLALKCLRSVLENALSFAYYKDHPVELERWEAGKHRLSAHELFDYIAQHPRLQGMPEGVSNLRAASKEYSTLSKAVHGSSSNFRMTQLSAIPAFASSEVPRLSMWSKREKVVLQAVNGMLLCLYAERLKGAAQSALRERIATLFSANSRELVRRHLGVALT